ncbi:MAG: AtpZ/AtpI family protein [Patescibacteria group bacterium]
MKQNNSTVSEVETFDMSVSDENITLNPRKRKEYISASSPVLSYVGFASNFGFSIALPLGLALIAGRYLDERFDFTPKATIVLLILGCIISIATFIRTIKDVLESNAKKN